MRSTLLLLTICLLTACSHHKDPEVSVSVNDTVKSNGVVQKDTSKMIVPGELIGKIAIDMDAANLEDLLGKPDKSDAAMSKAWSTWYGDKTGNKKAELNIYTAYRDTLMQIHAVQQIHITSPYFTSMGNNHVSSLLSDIKAEFPGLIKAASYKRMKESIILYDNINSGIAFEVNDQQVCSGIIAHRKGERATAIYSMLYPEMKI